MYYDNKAHCEWKQFAVGAAFSRDLTVFQIPGCRGWKPLSQMLCGTQNFGKTSRVFFMVEAFQ